MSQIPPDKMSIEPDPTHKEEHEVGQAAIADEVFKETVQGDLQETTPKKPLANYECSDQTSSRTMVGWVTGGLWGMVGWGAHKLCVGAIRTYETVVTAGEILKGAVSTGAKDLKENVVTVSAAVAKLTAFRSSFNKEVSEARQNLEQVTGTPAYGKITQALSAHVCNIIKHELSQKEVLDAIKDYINVFFETDSVSKDVIKPLSELTNDFKIVEETIEINLIKILSRLFIQLGKSQDGLPNIVTDVLKELVDRKIDPETIKEEELLNLALDKIMLIAFPQGPSDIILPLRDIRNVLGSRVQNFLYSHLRNVVFSKLLKDGLKALGSTMTRKTIINTVLGGIKKICTEGVKIKIHKDQKYPRANELNTALGNIINKVVLYVFPDVKKNVLKIINGLIPEIGNVIVAELRELNLQKKLTEIVEEKCDAIVKDLEKPIIAPQKKDEEILKQEEAKLDQEIEENINDITTDQKGLIRSIAKAVVQPDLREISITADDFEKIVLNVKKFFDKIALFCVEGAISAVFKIFDVGIHLKDFSGKVKDLTLSFRKSKPNP